MNLKLGVVIASFLALAGCHVGVGGGYYGPHYYGHGYGYYGGVHSSSYGSSGVVYNAPQPVAAPPRVVVASSNPVVGSDGTFGWRTPTATPDNELRRLNENLVRAQCHIQSTLPNETIAQCGSVITVVRIDSANAYKLCGQGTDANVCSATWSRIGP